MLTSKQRSYLIGLSHELDPVVQIGKNGVSPETAEEDACRVEHYISDETFSCMKTYFEKMQA